MPFGYWDVSRILIKVLCVPGHAWRKQKILVYVHIDDGLGYAASKLEVDKAGQAGSCQENFHRGKSSTTRKQIFIKI